MLDPSDGRTFTNRGMLHEKTGNFSMAIEDHQKAILLDSSSPEAYYNLGAAYARRGMFPQALAALDNSISVNPTAAAYTNRGVVHALSGMPEHALEDLNKAIDLDRLNADAYVNRANLYLKAGRKEEASRDFRKACELGDRTVCGLLEDPKVLD
jgi:tetratricopeptide (TPR) repeat protein